MEVREADVMVTNETGIHARPASAIVMAVLASGCEAQITNTVTGVQANGASTMALLCLEATAGTRLHIKVTGENAGQLLTTLTGLFESGFGEALKQ